MREILRLHTVAKELVRQKKLYVKGGIELRKLM